jgi:hypothetical protein
MPLRFADFHSCRNETASRVGHPDVCVGAKGVGAKGHTPLTARDEIEFPSLPSLRILKKIMKRRVAAFFEVLMRLQPATRSLLSSDDKQEMIQFMVDGSVKRGVRPAKAGMNSG